VPPSCAAAANLTPELRQNLLLHLQQNPKERERFLARHGVDVPTIVAGLDTGGAATAGMSAAPATSMGGGSMGGGSVGGGGGMQSAAAAPPQQLPAMAAALAAGPGMHGMATSGQPVLPMVGGTVPAGMGYLQQQQQQQGVGLGGAGLAEGYAAEALAAPKRQRTQALHENMGTSLLEYFSEQQIQTHVAKLQQKDGVQGGHCCACP
jgi:hypothetical protein